MNRMPRPKILSSMSTLPKIIAITMISNILGISATHAANIYSERLPDGSFKIVYDGHVDHGDDIKFNNVLESARKIGKVSSVHLNSGGGYVDEAWSIAKNIEYYGIASVVERNSHCESACFLMFIAGYPRITTTKPRIGVHRAAVNGKDNDVATQGVIDAAYRLGVVDEGVLKRLAAAPPSGMNYLSPEELRMIGVDVRP